MSKEPLPRRSRALLVLLVCALASFFIVASLLSQPETSEPSLWPLAIVPLLLFLGGAYAAREFDRSKEGARVQGARVGFGLALVMGLLLELFAFRMARAYGLPIVWVGAAWAFAGAVGAWFLRRDLRVVGIGALEFGIGGALAGVLPAIANRLMESGIYPAFILAPLAFVIAPVIGGLLLASTLRGPTWAGATPSS